ncbi:pilus assembly protein CpaE [Vallicoccus soli]|uniref:Pilus assembly protein CpaE n=1 Tax=Vallicoccus soli TaxID=2339232 RepID=A0A3A3Z6K7_9ACTN|nr:pilus assembly protein CpaE [Vallicoccus soli]RJK96335.1 pilus assembly protein CpaE [Vallicoccus soli]
MLPVTLAMRLRGAGLQWLPARGDRFVVLAPELEEEVFVLSDMVVEVHEFPTGPVLGFNGTTEWALDSVDTSRALWLPAEDQLRSMLGAEFAALEREGGRHRVRLADGTAVDAEGAAEAYGLALLHVLTRPARRA